MRLILTSLLLLSSSYAAAAVNCQFHADCNLDIDPAGLRALRIELSSSDLHVQGVAGLARIEVRGRACASEQDWLADLNVIQARSGDKVVVKQAESHEHHVGGFGNNYAYIDFEVRVPANLPLEVDSASGDADISNIAALDFSSASGDLKLDHATGAVAVKVSSGDVVASDLGSFTLHSSGSGDMHISDVRGEVKVGRVGSGDLEAERIGGDVVLGSIGSGDVDANHVSGSLIVKAAGSGEIHHGQIGGHVDVPKNHADD